MAKFVGGALILAEAVATDYDTLMVALVHRKREKRLSNLLIDDMAGLPVGYFGKLTCGDRGLGMRSLGPVLEALELVLFVQPKDFAGEPCKDALHTPGKRPIPRKGAKHFRHVRAQRAASKKWLLMTEPERKRHMRKMWKARSDAARAARPGVG
jgi:hypothetical protein